ncbi:hypothetical protein MWU65_11410, partial [Cellulophaga sp. F20128]|uniref:hypothetical protein n=1 Tax=Cellulophaga sp. F20128 TaxID=2926413 RepID=UPI001FF6BE66
TEGESRVRIIGVELIADGKPIYSNSEVRFIEREGSSAVYPLVLANDVRANNGASLKVTLDNNNGEIPTNGKVVLMLQD